jgi:hypothetical protein
MSEHKDPHRTDCIKRTPLVAERLLLLQEVLEGTGRGASARMAERLGITLHRWYNVLRGSPLSSSLAQRIVLTVPGVSLDWLYLGRPGGLSYEIPEKLGYGRALPIGCRRAKNQPRAKTIPGNPGPTIGPGVGSGHNDT